MRTCIPLFAFWVLNDPKGKGVYSKCNLRIGSYRNWADQGFLYLSPKGIDVNCSFTHVDGIFMVTLDEEETEDLNVFWGQIP